MVGVPAGRLERRLVGDLERLGVLGLLLSLLCELDLDGRGTGPVDRGLCVGGTKTLSMTFAVA